MGLGIKRLDNLKLGVDPILTNMAQQFENSAFVSNLLLPEVSVKKMTGKYPVFGSEHMRIHETDRPLKAPIREMPTDDWSMKEFQLKAHGLEVTIDYLEEESAADVMSLETYYSEAIMNSLLLEKEYENVSLLTTSGTYSSGHSLALGSGEEFNDADVDPLTVIQDAMEVIRAKINRLPNVMILGQSTFNAIQNNPKITERIKYSQVGVVTEDLLASMLSSKNNPVTIQIGTGMYENPLDHTYTDLWGDVLVMAYNKKFDRGITKYDQSFGKTFIQTGYPVATRSTDRNKILKYIAILTMYKAHITQKDAGLLISNTVSNS